MKINNILENMTPSSSTANQGGGQAPVMGRSDKFLETTSGASSSAVISPGGETTSKIQRRGKEGSNLLRGIKTSKKFVNSPMAESTVSEADISEEHLGAKERRKELFNKSKDRQLGNRPDSKDILPKDMEGEGDTLKNSLHTIIRVATHLDKALSVHDEFPEWISEKIGATKSMMVNIMNYVISNQEMQDDGEEINELSSEKLGQYKKAAGAQASELDKAAWAGAPDAKSKINKANKRFDGIVKATKKQFANDIKKHYDGKTQGVAEATGDKPFDNMMKTIKKGTQKQATADRREQKAKNKEQAAAAFGNMFGGGNPADKLKIKEQDVAEGVGETPQQQKVRAAISSGLAKSSQMGKAEYQSQPTNRHYFDNAGYASDKLTGIDSIDPDGTVVISIGDTSATAWVKKLAALGGMPGVKTREVQQPRPPGVAEGWKDVIAGGAMALGALGAGHAQAADLSNYNTQYLQQVVSGEHPRPMVSIDDAKAELQARANGKQQSVPTPAKSEKPKGFSKEYLQSVIDGTHPRPLISKERAQELLQQQTTNEQGVAEAIDSPSLNRYRDAIFSASIPQKKEMIKNLIDAVLINEPTMYKSYVFNLRGSNDPKFLNQMTDELAGYYLHKNQQGVAEESKGLWANIHAKQKRIKSGSGEHMRKPGSKGAPTAKSFKDSATKSVKETGAPAPTRMNPPREYDRRRGD